MGQLGADIWCARTARAPISLLLLAREKQDRTQICAVRLAPAGQRVYTRPRALTPVVRFVPDRQSAMCLPPDHATFCGERDLSNAIADHE